MTLAPNSHIGKSRELDTGQLSDNIKKHCQSYMRCLNSLDADICVLLKVNQVNSSGTSALRFTNLLSRLLDQVRPGSCPCTVILY